MAENDPPSHKNNDDQIKITILPPTNVTGDITDKDSGDEDGWEAINNLSGSMLLISAKSDRERNTATEDVNEPAKKKPKKKAHKLKPNWVNTDLACDQAPWIPANAHMDKIKAKKFSPLGYFKLFFDDELIDLIVVETNRYASQKNRKHVIIKNDINYFLGILILSGYVSMPRRRPMWKNAPDTCHELVANAMRRDKFEAILTNFHFADNNCLDDPDKFSKLRSLVKHLNKRFLENASVEEFYSFDESMCEHYGRHGCKQFLWGKPIRFGFKIWCDATTLGYSVWFDPYLEKKATSPVEESSFGLGRDLVSSFADVLQSQEQEEFHLCFDNFFTILKLVSALKEKFIKAKATICECRTEKCPWVASNNMKKLPRESFHYKTDPENRVIVCKWNDNCVVILCSNAVGIQSISSAS